MSFKFPYQKYDYIESNRRHVTIDFLAMTMNQSYFRPKVAAAGRELHLGCVVPAFFADQERLMLANSGDGFNENTHKATAYQQVTKEVLNKYGWNDHDEILGTPQVVPLDFECEDRLWTGRSKPS